MDLVTLERANLELNSETFKFHLHGFSHLGETRWKNS